MKANDRQVGGEHYKKGYQHWDFVCDTGMHYLLGCATKYLTRWREKNGLEDLEKPIHYLEKATEKGIRFPSIEAVCLMRFTCNMELDDVLVLNDIFNNDFESAITRIAHLIVEEQERLDTEAEATSGYVDQD